MFDRRPRDYVEAMRSAIALNGSFFNAQRIMFQYLKSAYLERDEIEFPWPVDLMSWSWFLLGSELHMRGKGDMRSAREKGHGEHPGIAGALQWGGGFVAFL